MDNSLALPYGLAAGEQAQFQRGLWQLMARQTALFTMGDHSSVPAETAEELLQSICFSIRLQLEALPPEEAERAIRGRDLKPLLDGGLALARSEIEKGKKLLERAVTAPFANENLSYHSTLKELARFFRLYDVRYFAHQVPCMIDYQLANGLPGGEGIVFINGYLYRLNLENDFCNRFARPAALALIQASCPDWVELLINLYEPLAVNALGLVLLGKDVFGLNITQADRDQLLTLCLGRTQAQRKQALTQAADTLCLTLALPQMRVYLRETALWLRNRMDAALPSGDLKRIFLTFLF